MCLALSFSLPPPPPPLSPLPPSPPPSLSLSLSHIHVCTCMCTLSFFLSVLFSVQLFLSVSVSHPEALSVAVSVFLSGFLSVCLSLCQSLSLLSETDSFSDPLSLFPLISVYQVFFCLPSVCVSVSPSPSLYESLCFCLSLFPSHIHTVSVSELLFSRVTLFLSAPLPFSSFCARRQV